jgi:Fe2+ or Zn2+ uptake regulation protein
LVLEAVDQLPCRATAEEIYNMVINEHPKVVVYQNPNQFAKNGDIRKLEVSGDADRFDY